MPGKKITDHQEHKYKEHRNCMTQVAAAAKAAISERSARRIEASDTLPSQRKPRRWRAQQGLDCDAKTAALQAWVDDGQWLDGLGSDCRRAGALAAADKS